MVEERPTTNRSKRARVPVVTTDCTRLDKIEVALKEETEESSDDFQERMKFSKTKAAEGASTAAAAAHRDGLSFIEVVKGEAEEIPDMVKRWAEHYEKNQKAATAELLVLLFEACGAKYHLQEEDMDETDVDDVVDALVTMARRGEVEDYQSLERGFDHFKDNVVCFLDNLVGECQNRPLFDQSLFDKCLDYIIALSRTPSRFYRQMASLMGLQLVTSLINVTKMLGSQRETNRRLNAENKNNVDGSRVESPTTSLLMMHEKIIAMEDMMRKIFTGLFEHRYRDIDPDIRRSCIESLGVWVLLYPSLFLQDLCLKYLGLALNDKSSGVRKASILALQHLYEVDDNVPYLNLLTERFYKRMLECVDDSDISVSVCAIGLVKQLLRLQLVSDEEIGSLYDLFFDDLPEVRHAIGELVYEQLIAQKFSDSQSHSSGSDGDSSAVHISRMLRILKQFSADSIRSSYIIDGLWDFMKAMKDWKCIIRMLLDDSASTELDDAGTTNLIRLLLASVSKAVGERIVPSTDNQNLYQTESQKEIFEDNRHGITFSMMKAYPHLLRKFMSDKGKVAPLVEVTIHMNLELYSLERQEQNFKALLELIREAFFKHGDKNSLRSCAKALNICATKGRGELGDFAQNHIKELEDELLTKLKSAIDDVVNGGDVNSLLVNLKRLFELQLLHQVPLEISYQDLLHFLQSFRNMDDDVTAFLLLNMFLHVTWCVHSVVSSESVSESALSSLLGKRDTLLEQLEYFLHNPLKVHGPGVCRSQLAYRVCCLLVDLWSVFKKTKFSLTRLERLGYSPDKSVVEKYWKMCQKLLNVSDVAEDEGNREYMGHMNADIMFALAKLVVVVDSIPKENLASEIISHVERYGRSIDEIVKYRLPALKEDIPLVMLEALKRAYQRYLALSSGNEKSQSAKALQVCKDLAVQLSGLYVGAARSKHEAEILNIINGGINYAFGSNLIWLQINFLL